MKNFALLVIMCIAAVSATAQNRIRSWDDSKITSINVELMSPKSETNTLIFKDRKDIETIVTFLRKIEFRDLGNNSIDSEGEKEFWSATLTFKGQREQVYLYKSFAHVGKTTFLVDGSVIDNFKKKIDGLVK